MRIADTRILLALVGAGCLCACATHHAPPAWRPSALVASRGVHGAWIVIEPIARAAGSPASPIVAGELIVADGTAFHVLTLAGLRAVPRSPTCRITLVAYAPPGGALAAWAAAGGASTLSHGGLLLLTAPMWAVAGIVAYKVEMRAGVIHDDSQASRFARFPQGFPPNFDPKSLGALSDARR